MRLSPKGRKAFRRYVETLRRIIDKGDEEFRGQHT
jgi:hypothetical protein